LKDVVERAKLLIISYVSVDKEGAALPLYSRNAALEYTDEQTGIIS